MDMMILLKLACLLLLLLGSVLVGWVVYTAERKR